MLGQAATVGASAGRRAAARRLRLRDGRAGDSPVGVGVVGWLRSRVTEKERNLNVCEMGYWASHWKAAINV